MTPLQDGILIEQVSPVSVLGQRGLWAYIADVVSRYHGRAATDSEIVAAIDEDPSDDLAPPDGLFLVARRRSEPIGCVGLRLLPGSIAELKRLFVAPAARGCGLGSRLVGRIEQLALEHGRTTMRLDTRSDLVEARSLYASLGYREVPAFNTGRYAEHWFEKTL